MEAKNQTLSYIARISSSLSIILEFISLHSLHRLGKKYGDIYEFCDVSSPSGSTISVKKLCGTKMTGNTDHAFSPESSGILVESLMDNGAQNFSRPSSSKPQEIDEARSKFPNAKSISSAQFFRDMEKVNDTEAKLSLQKFSTSTAISSDDVFGRGVNIPLYMLSVDELLARFDEHAEKDEKLMVEAIEEFKTKAASNVFGALIDLWNKFLE